MAVGTRRSAHCPPPPPPPTPLPQHLGSVGNKVLRGAPGRPRCKVAIVDEGPMYRLGDEKLRDQPPLAPQLQRQRARGGVRSGGALKGQLRGTWMCGG